MENNKIEIIDYEEIFHEEINNQKEPYENPNKKNNAIATILIYVIMFLLGFGAIITSTIVISASKKDDEYVLLSKIAEDHNTSYIYDNEVYHNIAYLDETNFLNYYEPFLKKYKDFIFYKFNYSNVTSDAIYAFTKSENEEYINLFKTDEFHYNIFNGDFTNIEDEKFIYITNVLINERQKDDEITNHFITLVKDNNLLNDKINFISPITFKQNSIILFLTYTLVFIPLLVVNRKDLNYSFFEFGKTEGRQANLFITSLQGFTYMLLANIVLGAASNILALIFQIKGQAANQASINTQLLAPGAFFLVIAVVILGPVVEELVFRKAIFDLIDNKKVAFILAASLFGMIHITTELFALFTVGFTFKAFMSLIIFSIPYIGMGFFLSYWYEKHDRDIAQLIIMHSLSNLFSVLATYLA